MLRRFVLFNLLLIAVLAAAVWRLRHSVIAFSNTHQVSGIRPETEKPLPKASEVMALPAKQDWTEIATRNPFSFDRNDVTLMVTPAGAQQPRKPKPFLFGVIMLGADRIAMLAPGEGPSRTSRPVRIGETIDGWVLDEIQEKSVTVRWEEVKESVIMNDPTAQPARDYSKTGGTASNAAPVVVSAPPPSAPATTTNAPTETSANAHPPIMVNGRRQIWVNTPFGAHYVDDPAQ
jgi:hypothetical protein